MKKALSVILISAVLGAHFSEKIKSVGHSIATTLGLVQDTTFCDSAYIGPNPVDHPGDFVYGIDISHWQSNLIRTPGKVSDSISYIICKATEGNTFVDPEFDANRDYLDSIQKFSGFYHFYRCNDSPHTQAKFFVSTIGKLNYWNLPPIVDLEYISKGSQCNCDSDMDSVLVFLGEVKSMTGRTPIVYTNYDFGHTHFPSHPDFKDYPLWLANYGVKQPSMFGPWTKWKFWQMTDHYLVGNDSIDLDAFHGTENQLVKFIGKGMTSKKERKKLEKWYRKKEKSKK